MLFSIFLYILILSIFFYFIFISFLFHYIFFSFFFTITQDVPFLLIYTFFLFNLRFLSNADSQYSLASRFMMSLSVNVMDGNDRLRCIKEQAIHTCTLGNWSGLIHFMALSSVLRLKIFAVYPDATPSIRSLCHGVVNPRESPRSDKILHIMFTRDSALDNRKNVAFQPNHFCPLFDKFLL